MNDTDNTYLQKGNTYLIEIQVDEYVKETEGEILKSIFKGSHVLPGLRVKSAYRLGYGQEQFIEDLKRRVLQDIQDGIKQIILEKL